MDIRKLVKMANEIGAYFESDPDRAAALAGIAAHLTRFWEPRMRRELVAYVSQTGGTDLKPIVLEAVQTLT